MPIFSYRVFVAIVEHKSFAAAARAMHMTPSAVSHSINTLENKLGVTLFRRGRDGASLTEEGDVILREVLAVLNAEEHLSETLARIQGLECGLVKIGTFNSVCINWIPAIVTTFRKQHPKIEISINQGSYADVLEWLDQGLVDIGFLSLTSCGDTDIVELFQDRMLCIAPASFRPARPDHVTIEDIRDQNFVYQRAGYDAETNAFLGRYGVTVNSVFTVENDDAIVALVESGFGICLTPELVEKKIIHNASVYPIEPACYRTICLATAKKRQLSVAAQKMHAHIVNFCRETDLQAL